MNRIRTILSLLFILTLYSCQKDDPKPALYTRVVGTYKLTLLKVNSKQQVYQGTGTVKRVSDNIITLNVSLYDFNNPTPLNLYNLENVYLNEIDENIIESKSKVNDLGYYAKFETKMLYLTVDDKNTKFELTFQKQ